MLSPRDRYQCDRFFTNLVDSIYVIIEAAQYTPTEIREAAMLAQIMYEERRPRTRWTSLPNEMPRYDKDLDNPYDASIKRDK